MTDPEPAVNPQAQSSESDGQLLQRLGDDASKWAAEFRQAAIRLGYSDMDEGWLIGWFANAIENAEITRRERRPAADRREMRGEDRREVLLERLGRQGNHS